MPAVNHITGSCNHQHADGQYQCSSQQACHCQPIKAEASRQRSNHRQGTSQVIASLTKKLSDAADSGSSLSLSSTATTKFRTFQLQRRLVTAAAETKHNNRGTSCKLRIWTVKPPPFPYCTPIFHTLMRSSKLTRAPCCHLSPTRATAPRHSTCQQSTVQTQQIPELKQPYESHRAPREGHAESQNCLSCRDPSHCVTSK